MTRAFRAAALGGLMFLGLGAGALAAEPGAHAGAAEESPLHYTGDDDHDGVANWRDPDSEHYVLSALGFHFLNFVIYGGIMLVFARPLIRDGLRARAAGIRAELVDASQLRAEAAARDAAVTQRLASLSAEIADMAARAEVEARNEEARILARAEDAVRRVGETAQRQIADEGARARRAIRDEAVTVAVQLAEGILSAKVQPADQQRLAAEFLSALKSEGGHAEITAAQRYARAIVELATDAGVQDAVYADLTSVVEAMAAGHGELGEALASPVFSPDERKAVLGAVLDVERAHPLTRNFLMLVADRSRLGLLPDVLRTVTNMLDERAGRVRVDVRTVDPLSAELAAELKSAFEKSTGKTVVLETRLDPTLLGGVVARLGGRVYDASLRTRLEDLKHRLIHAQAPAEA